MTSIRLVDVDLAAIGTDRSLVIIEGEKHPGMTKLASATVTGDVPVVDLDRFNLGAHRPYFLTVGLDLNIDIGNLGEGLAR